MKSSNLCPMSVLNSLLWHFRIHRVSIVCFAVCAILFALTISFVAGGREVERGDVDSVFKTEAQSCRLVVLLQPDDDEDEEDEEEEEADPFTPWRTTEAKVLGARRFVLKQQFQIEVDRVNGVCKLEPKQLKKLQVASKGGVKKVLKEWRKTTLQRFGRVNRNGANDDDREPVEEKVYTDVSEIDQQTLQLASNAYNTTEVTTANNEFWKKTLTMCL